MIKVTCDMEPTDYFTVSLDEEDVYFLETYGSGNIAVRMSEDTLRELTVRLANHFGLIPGAAAPPHNVEGNL